MGRRAQTTATKLNTRSQIRVIVQTPLPLFLKFLKVMDKFKKGKCKLLVATNIAEEGTDIQECKVVIYFDLMRNVKSYIQSRGRARNQNSHYIVFVCDDGKLGSFSSLN